MDGYKKISILLFLVVLILGIKLLITTNELKELKESKNISIETNNDKSNSLDKNENSTSSEEVETIIKDSTKNIDGLSDKDNKLVRETVIKFLKGYAHYLDKDNLSFDNRMKSRVYNIKDIMMPEIYENTRLSVETECMNLGENYIYRYLKGINIYDAKKNKEKVYINVDTKSIFFDFAMDEEVTNKENGESEIDYKFTLIKDNGIWKIENFYESYK
ncbi:hypothetical protein QRW90_16500 [Clostridioides difficile]|nr:hypothetical protein [Clostridioides difficile]